METIVPQCRKTVQRHPRGLYMVVLEGQFNGAFVFGARLAPVEASKQRRWDNTIN